jgi:hypothetical protein
MGHRISCGVEACAERLTEPVTTQVGIFGIFPPDWGKRPEYQILASRLSRHHGKRRKREQHASLPLISPVPLAVEGDQIPLFELQGDEDVSGRRDRKQEMPRVIRGVAQKARRKPAMMGWRTKR